MAGIHDATVVDAIFTAPDGATVLALTEMRPWTGGDDQLSELVTKLQNYRKFVSDGLLVANVPDAADKPVRFILSHQHSLNPRVRRTIDEQASVLRQDGIELLAIQLGESVQAPLS